MYHHLLCALEDKSLTSSIINEVKVVKTFIFLKIKCNFVSGIKYVAAVFSLDL